MPAAGTRIGPYEITGAIGAGGMGEVYRARDTRLNRDVAIKILPEIFAADPERLARFEREAQTLASLNHPHIAQVLGLEDATADGTRVRALVMELVEGEDLAERLTRGALPPDEALPMARQTADALDAAHERGIVHRDLKPANIRIRTDGTVKVLDFGLAKAIDPVTIDPSLSPTYTSPVTHMGVILGTAAYMSPEQAKGKPVDKRADIWAFGVVLYEMLTGRSPFASDTAVESLGLVVTRDPDWSALPASLPAPVVHLIRRCLTKEPKQRLRDIGEASFVLSQPHEPAQPATVAPSRSWRATLTTIGAVSVVLAAVVGIAVWQLKPSPQRPVRRLELPAAIADGTSFALAPDGTRIAYVAAGHLYVRDLDTVAPRDLGVVPVTAANLFWSPDASTIGFTAESSIRTVPAAGGPVFTVCRLRAPGRIMGIAWTRDGTIVYSAWRDSLYKVAASGGTPEVLLAVDRETEVDFHSVSPLPDGRLLVAAHMRGDDSDRLELLDAGRRTVLSSDRSIGPISYAAPGLLVFVREGANAGIWAVPFDGRPFDLADGSLVEPAATAFSAANDGTLVASVKAPAKSSFVWVSRDGSSSPAPGAAIEDSAPWVSISPDGTHAAYVSGARTAANVFVRDLGTGVDTRLTFNDETQQAATFNEVLYPTWFPSGDRIAYVRGSTENTKLVSQHAGGAAAATELASAFFGRVSRDGRWLIWSADERGRGHLRYAPLHADGTVGESKPVFPKADEPDVRFFDLSPDGRILAYSARQANSQQDLYLMDFPTGSGRWQVTTNGGTRPRFSRDGRELFFLRGGRTATGVPHGELMVMAVAAQPGVKLGIVAPALKGDMSQREVVGPYDVAPDGRILMARRVTPQPSEVSRAVLIENWPAAVSRK